MKALSSLVLLFVWSAMTTAEQFGNLTAKQIYDKWSRAVVTVKTDRGTGTGFFDESGRLITAFHVVKGTLKATIVFSDGKEAPIRGLTAADPVRDIAVLETGYYAGWEAREKGPKLGDYDLVGVGDRIVVIGSPLGLSGSITEGLASGKRSVDGRNLLQLSAGVSPGSSGSPVLNMSGEVVGMVVGSLESGQTLNFAISSKDLDLAATVPLWLIAGEAYPDKPASAGKSTSLLLNEEDVPIELIKEKVSGLIDLPDVSILVEFFPENMQSELSRSDVETWVRNALREGGPKIVSTEDQIRAAVLAFPRTEKEALNKSDGLRRKLYISIFTLKTPNEVLFYHCYVSVLRSGFISPGRFTTVTVWDKALVGYAGSARSPRTVLKEAIEKLARDFVAAWKLANKKG